MKKNIVIQFLLIGIITLSLCMNYSPVSAQDPVDTATETTDPTAAPTSTPSVLYSISADATARSGIPGSVVSYKITIQNIGGTDPVNFSISVSTISGWTPAPSAEQSSVSIPLGGSASVLIDVPIPTAATTGQNDKEIVTVSDGTNSQSINLITTVAAPAVAGKPLVALTTYYVNSGKVAAGGSFELAVVLQDTGTDRAYNVTVAFDGGTSFYPTGTGGVRSTSSVDAGSSFTAVQSFLGASELSGLNVGTIKATVTYADVSGTTYSDAYTLSLPISTTKSSGYYATATPAGNTHAQLVVTGYKTDVDLLQPGTTFNLSLEVKNMGASDATAVTMVLGGAGSSGQASSTPQAGGVSGSSGELTNFAPMNSSNLVYMGDLKKNESSTIQQELIVNTSTQPGVYTLKISFVYTNNKGVQTVDDQVITLLVYSLPNVQVDFYKDPGLFTAQMPNVLPLQVTNLGKKTQVLGSMKVTADGAELTNNISLVGPLDPGGSYTLDVNFTPDKEGPMDVEVTIDYTDDFNQPRTIDQKVHVEVQPAVEMTPGDPNMDGNSQGKDGMPADQQPETFWQKVGRFFKGLFGLDSGTGATPTPAATESAPVISYKG